MFLRKAARELEPLPIAMSGVRMGERVLQIGLDNPALAGAIAAKVGLSGTAAIVVTTDAAGERARRAAADAGVLLDVHVTGLRSLPFDAAAFDVIVVHAAGGLLSPDGEAVREPLFADCRRILRDGGRLIAIERGPASGLAAIFKRRPPGGAAAESATARALEGAGFQPVRVLAEREGYRFTEGIKGQQR